MDYYFFFLVSDNQKTSRKVDLSVFQTTSYTCVIRFLHCKLKRVYSIRHSVARFYFIFFGTVILYFITLSKRIVFVRALVTSKETLVQINMYI